ncbi:hypothetical protein V8E36_007736 [Tilletia maclaganii]
MARLPKEYGYLTEAQMDISMDSITLASGDEYKSVGPLSDLTEVAPHYPARVIVKFPYVRARTGDWELRIGMSNTLASRIVAKTSAPGIKQIDWPSGVKVNDKFNLLPGHICLPPSVVNLPALGFRRVNTTVDWKKAADAGFTRHALLGLVHERIGLRVLDIAKPAIPICGTPENFDKSTSPAPLWLLQVGIKLEGGPNGQRGPLAHTHRGRICF